MKADLKISKETDEGVPAGLDELANEERCVQSVRSQTQEGWTGYLVYCNAVVILGSSFMFGYNLAVVNGPYVEMSRFVNKTFSLTGRDLTAEELNIQWSLTVTLYLFGGIVGSTWFPRAISATLGKNKALIIGAAIGVLGECVIFIAPYTNSYVPFMVGRAITGFQTGLAMVLAPALINEQAPARLRGACGTLFSLGVAIGLEVANLLALPFILGNETLWQFLFLVAAGFYLLHGVGLFVVVESPRWLVDHHRESQAFEALVRLRRDNGDRVKSEFQEIVEIAMEESQIESVSTLTFLRDRQLWWPLVITIILHINNEMTGLSAVLIYASFVMTNAGLDSNMAAIANFGLSFGMVLGNLICAPLVDRVGRRIHILIGTIGLVVINVFLTIVLAFNVYQASIAGFAIYLITFTFGPGPIPWFMPAELFNQASRPVALQVAMFTNWVGNIIVSFAFPVMQLRIGCYSFIPFAIIAALSFIFFLLFLPETATKLSKYSPKDFAPGHPLLQISKRTSGRK